MFCLMASMVSLVSAVLKAFPKSRDRRLNVGLVSIMMVRSCSSEILPPGEATPYCCGPAASLRRSLV